jgi:hypothetical protein
MRECTIAGMHESKSNSRVGVDTSFSTQSENLLLGIDKFGLVIDIKNDLAFLLLGHALGTCHFEFDVRTESVYENSVARRCKVLYSVDDI